jgi:hypothetical protein
MAFLTSDAQVNCRATSSPNPNLDRSSSCTPIAQHISPPLSQVSTKGHRTHPVAAHPLVIIELAEGIRAQTSIPLANHSAVRSGFAGHPLNPRWTATKVVAWKTGREWRQGLLDGTLVVRTSDSLLVAATELVHSHEESIAHRHQGRFCFLPLRWFG